MSLPSLPVICGFPSGSWIFRPTKMYTLSRVPPHSDFNGFRHHLTQAVISNIQLILEKLQWYAEYDFKHRDLAERVLNYMSNHYFHAGLSAGDIARFAGISPQQLNVLLKRKNGMGIRQNLIRIRLEHAAELLENPDCSVKDAAALTGWHSPFYFGNSFRKHFGISPGEFRRQSSPFLFTKKERGTKKNEISRLYIVEP